MHLVPIFITLQVYVGQSNFLTNVPPLQVDDPSWVGNETGFDLPVENINSDLFTTVSSL